VAALVLCATLRPAQAGAQTVPFAFLIEGGFQQLLQSPEVRSDQVLISWGARAPFFAVVNGQKGPQQGMATMAAWSRLVIDPAFSSFGPLGGLITLDFGAFRAHLGLIETPTGLQTTVGVVGSSGMPHFDVIGSWLLGNGTTVGGTANDMVVAGLVRFGAPASVGTLPISINPIFPTVPFANDSTPFVQAQSSTAAVWSGSFYGVTQYGPVRTYSRSFRITGVVRDTASIMVLSLPGGSYGVLACSELRDHPGDVAGGFIRCSISGVGPALATLSGRLLGWSTGITSIFNWDVYQVQ
jgi:hypothetical protein